MAIGKLKLSKRTVRNLDVRSGVRTGAKTVGDLSSSGGGASFDASLATAACTGGCATAICGTDFCVTNGDSCSANSYSGGGGRKTLATGGSGNQAGG